MSHKFRTMIHNLWFIMTHLKMCIVLGGMYAVKALKLCDCFPTKKSEGKFTKKLLWKNTRKTFIKIFSKISQKDRKPKNETNAKSDKELPAYNKFENEEGGFSIIELEEIK